MTLGGMPYAPAVAAGRQAPGRGDDLPGADARPAPDGRGQRHARPGAGHGRAWSAAASTAGSSAEALELLDHPEIRPERRRGHAERRGAAARRGRPGPGLERPGDRLRRADQLAHRARRRRGCSRSSSGSVRGGWRSSTSATSSRKSARIAAALHGAPRRPDGGLGPDGGDDADDDHRADGRPRPDRDVPARPARRRASRSSS